MALLFTGCEEPVRETIEFPIEIMLPAEDMYSSEGAPERRVLGDPGQGETFEIPSYIYIFVVFDLKSGESTVKSLILPVASSGWVDDKNYVNETALASHYYRYKHSLTIETPDINSRKAARVYAAASNTELTLTHSGSTVINKSIPATLPTTEEQVLSITFSAASSEIQKNLKNIFSSPCNYKPDGETYYGTVGNLDTKTPSCFLVLYHVASKVDIMWNVASSVQGDVRLTYLEAENLYNGDCFLFKPTENVVNAPKYSTGYSYKLIDDGKDPVGRQWMGREYFYTIPYNNETAKFPIQLKARKNGDTALQGSKTKTIETDMSTCGPFVPWVRGTIAINANFSYDE